MISGEDTLDSLPVHFIKILFFDFDTQSVYLVKHFLCDKSVPTNCTFHIQLVFVVKPTQEVENVKLYVTLFMFSSSPHVHIISNVPVCSKVSLKYLNTLLCPCGWSADLTESLYSCDVDTLPALRGQPR